jgi:hypothetical protein
MDGCLDGWLNGKILLKRFMAKRFMAKFYLSDTLDFNNVPISLIVKSENTLKMHDH